MDNSRTLEQPKSSNFFKLLLSFSIASIGILWTVFEYVFPEPLVYMYNYFRPEYVLILISALVFFLSIGLFISSYLKNKFAFYISSPIVYILSCFAFFLIGMEYNSPDFTDGLPKVTAQHGSLFHRGIEFEHNQCTRDADTVSCFILVKNRRGQQRLDADDWRLVMKDGAIFKDHDMFRGGQEVNRYGRNLDLPQGVEAKIKVVFYGVDLRYEKILKLGFEAGNDELGFKNIAIR